MTMNDQILKYLNLDGISPEEKDELNQEIEALMREAVFAKAVSVLSDEKRDEFFDILEKETSGNEWYLFLKSEVKDFELVADYAIKTLLQDIKLGKVELKTIKV
jgi:hypothetical protein